MKELVEAFNIKNDVDRKIRIKQAYQKVLIDTENMNLEMQLTNFDRRLSIYSKYS